MHKRKIILGALVLTIGIILAIGGIELYLSNYSIINNCNINYGNSTCNHVEGNYMMGLAMMVLSIFILMMGIVSLIAGFYKIDEPPNVIQNSPIYFIQQPPQQRPNHPPK